MKKALITGANKGIGYEIARHRQEGHGNIEGRWGESFGLAICQFV